MRRRSYFKFHALGPSTTGRQDSRHFVSKRKRRRSYFKFHAIRIFSLDTRKKFSQIIYDDISCPFYLVFILLHKHRETAPFSNLLGISKKKSAGSDCHFEYRDANGAVLVYDITDEDSFQKVQTWVKELRYQPPTQDLSRKRTKAMVLSPY
jgi:hypothetical protein